MNWPGLGEAGLVWASTGVAASAVATRHAARCCFSMAFSYSWTFAFARFGTHAGRPVVSMTWYAGQFTRSPERDGCDVAQVPTTRCRVKPAEPDRAAAIVRWTGQQGGQHRVLAEVKEEPTMSALTWDDVKAVLKPAEDTVVAQIVAMGATKEELAEAYAWLQNDEAMMNAGCPLPVGRVSQIIATLQAVEDDAPGVALPD